MPNRRAHDHIGNIIDPRGPDGFVFRKLDGVTAQAGEGLHAPAQDTTRLADTGVTPGSLIGTAETDTSLWTFDDIA